MNALVQNVTAAEAVQKGAPQSLLRFLTCGSVDDGKSTLIGRVLYECGAVFEDQLESLEKDSKKFGTDGDNLDFALLVDGLSAEREQGITIDVAYRYFSSARRAFIVADTPGHEQYTRNMATGASTADLAILLVDARKGILPQTRRHAFINSLLRVRHIVVAVNKMDLVGFDKAVFDKIVADFAKVSAGLGFLSITFIPLSARGGDNVTKLSDRTPWYKGQPLLPYLEEIDVAVAEDARGGFPVSRAMGEPPRSHLPRLLRHDRLGLDPQGRAYRCATRRPVERDRAHRHARRRSRRSHRRTGGDAGADKRDRHIPRRRDRRIGLALGAQRGKLSRACDLDIRRAGDGGGRATSSSLQRRACRPGSRACIIFSTLRTSGRWPASASP